MFAQTVKPIGQRPDQWREIVTAHANGPNCQVYKSAIDFMISALEVPFHRERN